MSQNTLENISNNFSKMAMCPFYALFIFEQIIKNRMWYLSYCHRNDDTSRGLSKMLACDWLSDCLFTSSKWLLYDVIRSAAI